MRKFFRFQSLLFKVSNLKIFCVSTLQKLPNKSLQEHTHHSDIYFPHCNEQKSRTTPVLLDTSLDFCYCFQLAQPKALVLYFSLRLEAKGTRWHRRGL